MNTLNGIIQQYDPSDGLGWIQLDDGRNARFALANCRDVQPRLGMRVTVDGVVDSPSGKARAALVAPPAA